MSFFNFNSDDLEIFTLITYPSRLFSSSSNGVIGSVNVFNRRSQIEKDIDPISSCVNSTHDDADISNQLQSITSKCGVKVSLKQSIYDEMTSYMNAVNSQKQSIKKQKQLEILRSVPGNVYDTSFQKKIIAKNLQSHYRVEYSHNDWKYNNYCSLNFYSGSSVPEQSALLYPDPGENPNSSLYEGYVTGTYSLLGPFSFEFYINPKYKQESEHFNAGTIFHLSSSYAISLISGSKRDDFGNAEMFRLQLQLSASADIRPDLAVPGSHPNNFTFLSDDNSLQWNKWHHVVIRWGTSDVEYGTGSFVVDGEVKGTFVIPSQSIAPKLFKNSDNPALLTIGNYYVGTNAGNSSQTRFFSSYVSYTEGLKELSALSDNQPEQYGFTNPLNAELHDLSIKRYYVTDDEIIQNGGRGPEISDVIDTEKYAFYLGPQFHELSPIRKKYVNDYASPGGYKITPVMNIDGSTKTPFGTFMSGIGGNYINIENHVVDATNSNWPRCHLMSSSITVEASDNIVDCNEILYQDEFIRRRNTLILPCDDGNFIPSYVIAQLNSNNNSMHTDYVGNVDYSMVQLGNVYTSSSFIISSQLYAAQEGTQTFADDLIGPTPEHPLRAYGPALSSYMKSLYRDAHSSDGYQYSKVYAEPNVIYSRTFDKASNNVTLFNISNLYYGMKIKPGSFSIKDVSITGSNGRYGITLNDDGFGGLYRSDCYGKQATTNTVGTVFYDEGLIAIINPYLNLFGKDQFEISFKGVQNVHVAKYSVTANANTLNSSKNPSYKLLSASLNANDQNSKFVAISGINFHDDNYNIVMKSQLAQPIVKRTTDTITFKVKFDF